MSDLFTAHSAGGEPPRPTPADLTADDRGLLESVRQTFAGAMLQPLFTTDTGTLWELFLKAIPYEAAPVYRCNTCRRFVENYGGLVTIDPQGDTASAIWGKGPGQFEPAISAMAWAVRQAPVTGVFVSAEQVWGVPETIDRKRGCLWQHFALVPPPEIRHRVPLKTAAQAMAEKLEDFGILRRACQEIPPDATGSAWTLLSNGSLYRSEKAISITRWLLDLQEALLAEPNKRRRLNLIWRAVVTAPPGFVHVRNTVAGSLLEDLAMGVSFADLRRRWNEKMHPLRYQRPTAAPTAGNIVAAERAVVELGLARSLERRFARLEDVQVMLWQPPPPIAPPVVAGGVFAHLTPSTRPAHEAALEAPPVTMTWKKFEAEVLPGAERIEFWAPPHPLNIMALVTAQHPDSPPILQWDRPDRRNPVSWYLYRGGQPPEAWKLEPRAFNEVTAITPLPSMWSGGGFEHQGAGVVLLLAGAQDLLYHGGACFFPEQLRTELREYRSTLEAFARASRIAGEGGPMACGLDLRKGSSWDHLLRVTTRNGRSTYRIDRWD